MIQDYGFRLYNPAIAKFLSVDPLAPNYSYLTPYAFAENSVVKYIDLDGLEKAEEPGFFESFFVTTIKGVGSTFSYINNNPAHAGYSVKPQKITKEQIEAYSIDWSKELDPYYQIESFAEGGVKGIIGLYEFGEGIYEGDGAKTARNLPAFLSITPAGKVVGGLKGAVGSIVRKSAGGASNYIKHLAYESRKTTSFGFNPLRSKSGRFTEPTLPKKKVVEENGVILEHYYKSNDHYEGHLHVIDKSDPSGKTTIGSGGEVIEGTLSTKAKDVIKNNRTWINRSVKKINKWLKFHNPSTIKGVEKPPLKDL